MDLHWVNRSYMSMWADPKRPFKGIKGKDSPYVWKLDIETKKIKKKDPRNIANKPTNYYPQEMEKRLSVFEGRFLSVIKNKLELGKELTEEDKVNISIFISLAIHRKPNFNEGIGMQLESIINRWVLPHLVEDIKLKEYTTVELLEIKKEYQSKMGKEVDIETINHEIKELNIDNISLSLNKEAKFSILMGENIDKWANFILRHKWLFLEGENFVTGDLNYFSIFPLTPKLCLTFLVEEPAVDVVKLTDVEEKEVNYQILNNCDSFVISQNCNVLENLIV